MHIALCGPATLSLLQPYFPEVIDTAGYPFPLLPTLVDQYVQRGHRVSVITTATDIDRVLAYSSMAVDVYIVPSRARPRKRALDHFRAERIGIRDVLRGINADVVHAHWTYEFALAAAAADVSPTLVTAHDAPLTILHHLPDAYRLIRATMAYRARVSIKHLTAVSPYLANRWNHQMAYRHPIAVIPNPTPKLDIQPHAQDDTRPRVLSVADASRRKNVRSLIQAFPAVRVTHPGAILRLIGPGLGPTGELAIWARKFGLAADVDFVGQLTRTQLSVEYAAATVFCHTSVEESQSVVLLEALSAGLPIVAGARAGAVPWTLFDGRAGRLVNVRDPRMIAAAISDAIDDPATTVESGFDVVAALAVRYSADVVASQYLAEYERLLDGY